MRAARILRDVTAGDEADPDCFACPRKADPPLQFFTDPHSFGFTPDPAQPVTTPTVEPPSISTRPVADCGHFPLITFCTARGLV